MGNMEQLELYIPKLEDLWFYQKIMADPETMSYNAGWDVEYEGYHRDTGCNDYPDAVLGSETSRTASMLTSSAALTVRGSVM